MHPAFEAGGDGEAVFEQGRGAEQVEAGDAGGVGGDERGAAAGERAGEAADGIEVGPGAEGGEVAGDLFG